MTPGVVGGEKSRYTRSVGDVKILKAYNTHGDMKSIFNVGRGSMLDDSLSFLGSFLILGVLLEKALPNKYLNRILQMYVVFRVMLVALMELVKLGFVNNGSGSQLLKE